VDRRLDHDRPALTHGPYGRWVPWAAAAAPVAVLAVAFAWPVAAILARGLTGGAIGDVLANAGIRQVIWFTVWQAVLSTALTIVAGIGPAYVLARYRFPGRRLVHALVTVPFVLPTVVVAAAVAALLPERFDHGVPAILAAHVLFNVSVVVRTVGAAWEHLDPDLPGAARTLGAGPVRAFWLVTLPQLRSSLLAAASIVFLFTFTSYGVVRLLGGPSRATVEVEIYLRAAQLGDLRGAAALAVLQLVSVGLLLWWWGRAQARHAVASRARAGVDRRAPRTTRQRIAVSGVALATTAAVLAPLAALVRRSMVVGGHYTLDAWRHLDSGEIRPGVRVGADPLAALGNSLRFAVIATTIAVVLGGLAALAIAYGGRAGWVLDAGLMLPLGTSAVTLGFGILITFDDAPLDLRSSPVLVPVVHALVATPFVVRATLGVLRSVPQGLRDAAATLGASPRRVWREVDAPLVGRALAVGAGFAFAVSVGEFGATSFLTRRGNETLPIAIARLLGRTGDILQAQAYALATILAVVTLAAVLLVDALGGSTRAKGDW
jgi:thiamine transport system permease protein